MNDKDKVNAIMRLLYRSLIVGMLVVTCVAILGGCIGAQHRLRGIRDGLPKPAPDFTLRDQTGRPVSLKSQRGKVVLLYFGYTSCPDVCPITLAQLNEVWRDLGPARARLQVIFVTVDPERDTEEVMARYLGAFNDTYIGLTGTPEQLAAVYDAYAVTAEKRPQPGSATGYTVDHTASTFVIDAQGNLVERLPYGTPIEDILADVRYLVQQIP